MRFSKLSLLLMAGAATVAGAGGTIALERLGLIALPEAPVLAAVKIQSDAPIASPETLPGADRFAYVSLQVGALSLSPPVEEPVEDMVAPLKTLADEILPSWSTETRAERVVPLLELPRLAIRPPQASAWSSPKASAPLRDYRLARKLAEISPGASRRLTAKFGAAKVAWPPSEVAYVTIKDEKVVELHARPEGGAWKLVHRYPVLAASGKPGPKLEQGDKQVPEGVYGISYLNPASRYHVSLRVNYPNAFDRQMAAKDKRKNLGGDIMFHGKAVSAGCIAVGDAAAEELFVLAAEVGLPNVKVVIAPSDFRRHGPLQVPADKPDWLPGLYTQVASAMTPFKAAPPPPSLLSSFFGT
jgi:hypothetical protein